MRRTFLATSGAAVWPRFTNAILLKSEIALVLFWEAFQAVSGHPVGRS